MSLSFTGPGGSVERRWIVYALLRDNIQHHLEDGTPSDAFHALHAMAAALGHDSVTVAAPQVAREMAQAARLVSRPISALAVSSRTLSVLMHRWPPPTKSTLLVTEVEMELPLAQNANTLGDVFGSLIEELSKVASGGGPDAVVEVSDS